MAQPLRPPPCAQGDSLKAWAQPLLLSPEAGLCKQKPSTFSRACRLLDSPPSSQQFLWPDGHLLGYERGRSTIGYQGLKCRLPTSTAVMAPAGERAEACGSVGAAEAGAVLPALGEDPFQVGSALRKHKPCIFLVTQYPRTEVFPIHMLLWIFPPPSPILPELGRVVLT